jgi:nucleotide-binding universal stress UspA family protein
MYRHILVPISFDPDRDITGAVKLAKLLCSEDGDITLLHVVEQIPAYAISYMPPDFMTQAREALQQELDGLAATLPHAKGLLIDGHSGRSILDWADTNEPDLIIISSHRPGMQDLLLGSTASQVVRHANCAVHVMR